MRTGMTKQNDTRNIAHPFSDPFETLDRRLNGLLSGMFDTSQVEATLGRYPVDVEEDEDKITIEAEVPGFKRDEIDINVDNGVLTIKAEREAKQESEKTKRHLSERRYTKVQRSFTLPRSIDTGDVDAQLDGGVLTVVLKKSEESKPRKIQIRD